MLGESIRRSAVGEHTTALRVHNPARPGGLPHSRFCRLALGATFAEAVSPLNGACGSLVDAGARAIAASCPSLTELRMPGASHLSVDGLCAVLRGCPALHELELRGCCTVGCGFAARWAALEFVSPRPSPPLALRRLDLSHADLLADSDLVALLALTPNLTILRLNFCVSLTDACLDELPPSLERLEALGCAQLSYGRLQALANTLGPENLLCDDSFVQQFVHGPLNGPQAIDSLLRAYRCEEMRRE